MNYELRLEKCSTSRECLKSNSWAFFFVFDTVLFLVFLFPLLMIPIYCVFGSAITWLEKVSQADWSTSSPVRWTFLPASSSWWAFHRFSIAGSVNLMEWCIRSFFSTHYYYYCNFFALLDGWFETPTGCSWRVSSTKVGRKFHLGREKNLLASANWGVRILPS